MVCDNCNEKEASVFLEEYSGGHLKKIHLCADCAAGYHMTISFGDVFQGLLKNMEVFEKNRQPLKEKRCSKCGLTYSEFKKTGKLGCGDCYESFSEEISKVLERIHLTEAHRGKIPKGRQSELLKPRMLESLRAQLKKAVESEEYEEAAKLRDKIIEVEKGGAPNE